MTSSNANSDGAEEIWGKSSLLKAVENVVLPRNTIGKKSPGGRMQQLTVLSRKNGDAWNPERKVAARRIYQKAKWLVSHAIYLAKSQVDQKAPKDPSPSSSNLFRFTNQMRHGNLIVPGQKPVQAVWKDHYEHLSNVEFNWHQTPSQKTQCPMSHLRWWARWTSGWSVARLQVHTWS